MNTYRVYINNNPDDYIVVHAFDALRARDKAKQLLRDRWYERISVRLWMKYPNELVAEPL